MKRAVISIVIPTLNEAPMLAATLAHIRRNQVPHEIIVVDATSTDETIQIAEAAGCNVVRAADPHRARQMNLGGQHARGEILFFLHADTLIPSEALRLIEGACANPQVAGGGFRRRFLNAPMVLRLTCALADVRGRWLGWFFGDQGIFVRRLAFERLDGFGDLPVFEDLDLCRRLKRAGKVVCLGPPVRSSARRFAQWGTAHTVFGDAWLSLRYLCGANPHRLADSARTGIMKRTEPPPQALHS